MYELLNDAACTYQWVCERPVAALITVLVVGVLSTLALV